MLKFRKTKVGDFSAIAEMNNDEFLFKQGELSIVDGVIINDKEEIVAFGIVKPFAEAIFIANYKTSQFARGKALNILMSVAIAGTQKFGAQQLHVFVEDPKLAEGLIKHHGFLLCPEIKLVKNL